MEMNFRQGNYIVFYTGVSDNTPQSIASSTSTNLPRWLCHHHQAPHHNGSSIGHAVLSSLELRSIANGITSGTANSAWTMDDVIIFFDGLFYLLTSSPLLPNIIETILAGDIITWLQLLVVDFYKSSQTPMLERISPKSVIMTTEWPQGIAPHTHTIFSDEVGCLFDIVDRIYLGTHNTTHQLDISPTQLNYSDLFF